MSTKQDQSTSRMEGTPLSILPGIVAQILTAAEGRSLLEFSIGETINVFRLIVAMIQEYGRLAGMRYIEMFPIGDGLVGLQATVVGMDTRFNIVLDPPLRTMLLTIRHKPHSGFHAMREELSDMGLSGELNASGQGLGLGHLGKVFTYGHVSTEMEQLLQAVAIDIPHAVEIAGGEPISAEYLFGFRATDAIQEEALELIVAESVLGTGTDIVVAAPELGRYFGTAYTLQQSTAILYGSPLQDAADGDVEHDGVIVAQDSRIEDARLAEAHPAADTGVGDDTFGLGLGESIVVVSRHAYRVAGTSPVEGFAAIAHLGYRTDINYFGLPVLRLGQYGAGDILGRRYIGAQCCAGTIVGLRRDHAADVQHNIGTGNTLENILVAGEVAPNNG